MPCPRRAGAAGRTPRACGAAARRTTGRSETHLRPCHRNPCSGPSTQRMPSHQPRQPSALGFGAVARTWGELLGDGRPEQESAEERSGLFSRLRDSLGRSRRALTEELAAAAFDPGDTASWERLEEALIAGDVGVPATAELVQRLEARPDTAELTGALAEEVESLLGDPGTLTVRGDPAVVLVVGVNGTGKTTTI